MHSLISPSRSSRSVRSELSRGEEGAGGRARMASYDVRMGSAKLLIATRSDLAVRSLCKTGRSATCVSCPAARSEWRTAGGARVLGRSRAVPPPSGFGLLHDRSRRLAHSCIKLSTVCMRRALVAPACGLVNSRIASDGELAEKIRKSLSSQISSANCISPPAAFPPSIRSLSSPSPAVPRKAPR